MYISFYFFLLRNKLFALFILLWVIWAFVLFYIYFFLYYTATLVVDTNIESYKVSLFSKKTAQSFEYSCWEKRCTLLDIPPFEYNMTLSSTGYKDEVQTFTLKARKTQEVFLTMEKQVRFEKVEEVKTGTGLTAQEKIEALRKQKSSYALFPLMSGKEIQIEDLWWELVLIYEGKELFRFEKIDPTQIEIQEIDQTDSIYIKAAQTQGILDSKAYSFTSLEFIPKIFYIKWGSTSQELIFISDKGAFTYNKNTKIFTYFYAFLDYIPLEKEYIGLIYADEDQKKKNYNLQEEKENLIIRYNPDSKERKILYRTNLKIEKIYKKGEQIFFETNEGKYELENF